MWWYFTFYTERLGSNGRHFVTSRLRGKIDISGHAHCIFSPWPKFVPAWNRRRSIYWTNQNGWRYFMNERVLPIHLLFLDLNEMLIYVPTLHNVGMLISSYVPTFSICLQTFDDIWRIFSFCFLLLASALGMTQWIVVLG